jgi:CBS domain-containing membrane protein
MTTDLVTLNDTASVAQARRIMGEENVRHLPIVSEAGEFVGLLTQRDVLAATVSVLADVDQTSVDEMEEAIPVRELMTTAMATTQEDTNLRDAALYMLELRMGCLPVLSDGRLVGILTETDFIKFTIHLLDRMDT